MHYAKFLNSKDFFDLLYSKDMYVTDTLKIICITHYFKNIRRYSGYVLGSFRVPCAHLQSDDQGAGHLGGLLHVEELRVLSPGRSDATRRETGELNLDKAGFVTFYTW